MATSSKSSSIKKAQAPVSCYFCKGQGIKWRCDDCNVRMCSSCKVTVHQELPSTQDHEVVSIQDIRKSSPMSQKVTPVVISSIFNSYITTLPAIHTLRCSDDDLLYFTCCKAQYEGNQLIKGKLLKSSIKTLQTFNRKIFAIAVNKDGEILLVEFRDHRIQILSPAGEVKTVLDTSPMMLLALHVNKDNEVIIGLREQGPPFPVTDYSTRQVIVLGNDYQRKVTLEFDKKGNKLFGYAARICTDSSNVVYVIDRFDTDHNGRIVAVDRNGRLKFTYDGPKDLGTFQPHGITITPSDNIVVTDTVNNALHVINSKGDLLGMQLVFKDFGIYHPHSVCFDSEGYLLIGCLSGKNEDYGKIHVVKMTDSLI